MRIVVYFVLSGGLRLRAQGANMKRMLSKVMKLANTSGQDLIEYALMAGFIAVASGAVMPSVSSSISTIFSKTGSVLKIASTQGS
jgi:Flp pilus assembly pilin Flp